VQRQRQQKNKNTTTQCQRICHPHELKSQTDKLNFGLQFTLLIKSLKRGHKDYDYAITHTTRGKQDADMIYKFIDRITILLLTSSCCEIKIHSTFLCLKYSKSVFSNFSRSIFIFCKYYIFCIKVSKYYVCFSLSALATVALFVFCGSKMQLRTPMQMQSTANYIFVMVCN